MRSLTIRDHAALKATSIQVGQIIESWSPEYYWSLVDGDLANSGSAGVETLTVHGTHGSAASPFGGSVAVLDTDTDCFTSDSTLSGSLNFANGFTCGLFVKFNSTRDSELIACASNAGAFTTKNFDLVANNTGAVSIFLYSGNVRTIYTSSVTTLFNGSWHLIVAQYNLTTVEIWVDGSSVLSTARAVPQNNVSSNQRFVIGGMDQGSTGGSTGTFSSVAGVSVLGSVAHVFVMNDSIDGSDISDLWAARGF